MEKLQKIDEYFFRIINSVGLEQMDGVMMLISSKELWIPLYIYILYLIFKRFPSEYSIGVTENDYIVEKRKKQNRIISLLIGSIILTIMILIFFYRIINSDGLLWYYYPLLVAIPVALLTRIVILDYLSGKNYNKFLWILTSLILLILLADQGSVHLFKNVFERLRPCHQLENIRIVESCGGLYGFVSSHAANTFALAFLVSLLLKSRKVFFFLFSWAVLIGFSRVYLGVHFPFDIVGGMFWGFFVSLLTYKLLKLKINEAI